MRIKEVTIKNFRSIKTVTLTFEQYTALIGANGAGKSSVLYALDWFFNDRPITKEEHHRDDDCGTSIDDVQDSTSAEIGTEVEVVFNALTKRERTYFKQYLINDFLVIKKDSISKPMAKFKSDLILEFRDCYNFAGGTTVRDFQKSEKLYAELISSNLFTGLKPMGPTSDMAQLMIDIKLSLMTWHQSNSPISPPKDDPIFLKEKTLVPLLKPFVTFLLIPATSDEKDLTFDKSPAILELLKNHIGSKGKQSDSLRRIKSEAKKDVQRALDIDKLLKDELEEEIGKFLPTNRGIYFTSEIIRPEPTMKWKFALENSSVPLNQQGHGIQRAVLIALLKASKNKKTSTTIIAIEEPEIYQHPVRVRHLASVLLAWAKDQKSGGTRQMICATHSPSFILPTELSSIRIFSLDGNGCTTIKESSVQAIALKAEVDDVDIEKFLLKGLPTQFSEAFFSEGVVLVEGDTDVALIEGFAEKNLFDADLYGNQVKASLSGLGVSVIPLGGGGELKKAAAVLSSFDIPVYVVFDSDWSVEKQEPNSQYKILSKYLGVNKEDFEWGVSKKTKALKNCFIFAVDLETELAHCENFYKAWRILRDEEDIAIHTKRLLDISKSTRRPYSAKDRAQRKESTEATKRIKNANHTLKGNEGSFLIELSQGYKADGTKGVGKKNALAYKNAALETELISSSSFMELFARIVEMVRK